MLRPGADILSLKIKLILLNLDLILVRSWAKVLFITQILTKGFLHPYSLCRCMNLITPRDSSDPGGGNEEAIAGYLYLVSIYGTMSPGKTF